MSIGQHLAWKMLHSLLLLFILFVSFVVYGEVRKCRIQRKLKDFAVPKQLPFIGVAGRFINKTNEQLMDMLNELISEVDKTPIQVWFGPFLGVVIAEPKDIQVILSSDDCINRPYFYDHLGLGTSVTVARRELWKPQRRAFDPLFSFKTVRAHMPQLNDKAKILAKKCSEFIEQPGDIYRATFIAKIDMILRTATGADQHMQTTEMGAFLYKTIKQIMSNMMYRMTRIWLKWHFTYSLTQVYRSDKALWMDAQRFLERIIKQKFEELENSKQNGIDQLAVAQENGTINLLEKCLLLERRSLYTRAQTIDQLHAIIVGGVVSSTITIYSTLLMLAIHQNHQKAVVAELKSLCDSAQSDITNENVNDLLLLERCIREAMRLYTPTPVIARHTSNEIQLASGTIPKETMVILDIFHLHRNPMIWGENALEFDPDRFLAENITKRPPFSYIPFSGGSRNCMSTKYAMISMKITLAHLLRQYKFSSTLKMNDIRFKLNLAMDIINENPMNIQRRAF